MRYHAHMQFRVHGEFAGQYKGEVGTIVAIDFSNWLITLRMPDGSDIVTGRQATTLVNHEACDAPGCEAEQQRTETEP